MSGSEKFHVELSTDFDAQLESFFKRYYGANPQALERFIMLLDEILGCLEVNPRNRKLSAEHVFARPEPLPKKVRRDHQEAWKVTFLVPGHAGAAEQGRLMYLIESQQNVVSPFYLYTHRDTLTRPSDKEIKRMVKRCF